MSFSFLRSAPPDGRSLVAEGRVTERQDDLVLASATVTDGDGRRLATLQETGLILPVRSRQQPSAESMLATVLFTDLVESTARLRKLGDERWQVLLGEHQAVVRRQLEVFRGREIKTTGDGFLATFDSPARALKCALAVRADVEALGLELRAGIHTGECEVLKGDVSGIAVHLAARVLGAAAPGEVEVAGGVDGGQAGLLGGTEINRIGDGFFVAFDRADSAVRCAVEIQRALARHRVDHGFAPGVRIGLHEAEATREGSDYQGRGVHEAARIAGTAQGDEILVSAPVAAHADGWTLAGPRTVKLKGLSQPVDVFSVAWR
jgi:class 3 adenylate cyclase